MVGAFVGWLGMETWLERSVVGSLVREAQKVFDDWGSCDDEMPRYPVFVEIGSEFVEDAEFWEAIDSVREAIDCCGEKDDGRTFVDPMRLAMLDIGGCNELGDKRVSRMDVAL